MLDGIEGFCRNCGNAWIGHKGPSELCRLLKEAEVTIKQLEEREERVAKNQSVGEILEPT